MSKTIDTSRSIGAGRTGSYVEPAVSAVAQLALELSRLRNASALQSKKPPQTARVAHAHRHHSYYHWKRMMGRECEIGKFF